jgi:uncharacterized protein YceK
MNDKLRNKRILAILLVLLMVLGGAGAILSVTDAKESAEVHRDGRPTVGVSNVPHGHNATSKTATDVHDGGAAFGLLPANGFVENVNA